MILIMPVCFFSPRKSTAVFPRDWSWRRCCRLRVMKNSTHCTGIFKPRTFYDISIICRQNIN